MRMTIDMPDELMQHLKARACTEGSSLRDLVLDLIERGLRASAIPPVAKSALPTLRSGRKLTAKHLSHAALCKLAKL